jgi:hypothetical protein
MIEQFRKRLSTSHWGGLFALAMVWMGLAVGHSQVIVQRSVAGGIGTVDTVVGMITGVLGFTLVWIGLKKSEDQATLLGYLGGSLIWVGIFEWTWEYFGHWLALTPIMADDIPILMPGLQMIQSTSLIVIAMLIFLGTNKDTRCRMFMWFHRNFNLRPGRMTGGYKRQYARITAMETVFLIWFIYLCAIVINDPRLIRYDSVAAMIITIGFVVWGIYLVTKLMKIRGLGASLRYAIPTGHILWLPIEAFSRWGLYPEIWIKPLEYRVIMSVILIAFATGAVFIYRSNQQDKSPGSLATA